MADYSLNDIVLFDFISKDKKIHATIKGTIIALSREMSSKNIKAYILSVHPEDVPDQVKALKLQDFTAKLTNDILTNAKNKGSEIVSGNVISLVGTMVRVVPPEVITKLVKGEDDDAKEKRRQIKFFFKDMEEPWIPWGSLIG
jgi:hypothetical protein